MKNAIKFTQSGYIKVSMAFDRLTEMLIVHIRDTGRGIDRADLGNIFKRFGKLK